MMKKPSFGLVDFKHVPAPVWLLVGAVAAWGIFTPNPFLTLSAALSLAWFFLLLWRPGEPPMLLLALGFQWLQVVTKLFNANVLNLPVHELSQYGGDVERAIWLSLIALAVLALGMRLALARSTLGNAQVARNEAMLFSPFKLWLFYLAAVTLSIVLLSAARIIPGAAQLALALSGIKWVAYFLLAYVSFVRPGRLHLLSAAFGIELALGLGGYFSSFKTVFFVTIVALVASGKKVSGKQMASLFALAAGLFAMSLAWTAVKIDYRDYVSGGERAQIVTRGYGERVQKLFEMTADLEKEDLANALQDMADRISYVEFFGRALIVVPRRVPHEEGELWLGAIRHIFMPRLFFPDKPPLRNDSEITNQYTGLSFAGEAEGTSVSIGYVAESYIDFGSLWMYAPIFAFGYLLGSMYRYLTTRPRSPLLLGYGWSVVVLLGAMFFETTNVKLLGGVVTTFLVAFVVQRFFARKLARRLVYRLRDSRGQARLPLGGRRLGRS